MAHGSSCRGREAERGQACRRDSGAVRRHVLPPVYYSDRFVLPLPAGHRFPMAKYRLLREHLLESGVLDARLLRVPPPCGDEQLRLAHEGGYVERVVHGALSAAEQRRLGFPWSPQLVARSRRSVGGTVAAARVALRYGVGVNLAGGTHHAFADRGEGYCVFNDAAVAIRVLQAEGRLRTAAVIDCDVHQGNGTAAIFRDDPSVFTLSLHGRRNFPFRKERGDLDVALEDGTTDGEYLAALERALDTLFARFTPELAVYVSGADPYRGDRIGRLALSEEGLQRRDRCVFAACRERSVPVAVVMAGGYCPDVRTLAAIHARTVEAALATVA